MKFEVTYNIRLNMFGKKEGTQTIMMTITHHHTIDECLNEIIFLKSKIKIFLN